MVHMDFPFSVGAHGGTRATSYEEHVRDMVEQVLFTSPGERVNRPDFGTGVLQLVFAPLSDALVAATRVSVQAALQHWLSEEIVVEDVDVERNDSTLIITVSYLIRRTATRRVDRFERAV
jgi:phage baseplate assembly protein W